MNFALSEEQEELQGLARRILETELTLDRRRRVESDGDLFDRELWAHLAKANLLGTAVPEAYGGLGYGFLDLCLLLREIGRAVAPIPAVPTLVSGALSLAEFGTAEQRSRWLPGVVSGEVVLTAALAEAGGDARLPLVTATPDGHEWRLEGTSVAVPYADLADAVLVPVVADGDGTGVFLVHPGAAGVSLVRSHSTNHEPQCRMDLAGVGAGADDLLGGLDHGAAVLGWVLDRTTVALCAVAAGVTHEALRITAGYTTERKQFDRPIGSFQAVGQRLADAYIDTQAVELTMLQAASRLDRGEPAAAEVAVAKFWAAEGGNFVGHAALHVHGGISIDLDYPIHRYFQWAKHLEFVLGSATPQLRRLGHLLAEEPA